MLTSNNEPWNRSIADRLSAIYTSMSFGKKIVMYIYEQADTSTFRYRDYNVMCASRKSDKWYADYFFSNSEEKTILETLKVCDIIVIVRVQWTFFIERLIAEAKVKNKIVLFDCDDLVFDLDSLPILMNTLGFYNNSYQPDYIKWFSYVSRIGLTASKCDGFITTNDYLGRIYKDKFNKDYKIIKNSLNNEQIEASEKALISKKRKMMYKDFTIGYFSGSPSHTNDFLQVAPEIARFLDTHENSQLQVVGFMDFPEFMKKYIDNGQIRFQPLVDFIHLQELMALVHVNIVPLVNNKFTNCKSELKFFEGAIVDTITVATPTFAYVKTIEHSVNGFLCNPGEWFDTLDKIYYKKIDCNRLVQSAHEYAINNFYGSKITSELDECYQYFTNNKR